MAKKVTPMMQQYMSLKKELTPDVLLFFRMGDFYELFFEDAERSSKLLDITLTKRAGVPMSGVPHHALKEYLPRLLEAGVKAAIAEQVEEASQAKGLVKRAITQVITPGTILEGSTLDAGRSNFLVALVPERKTVGLASLDVSTGEFRVTQLAIGEELDAELHRLQPAECLVPEAAHNRWERDEAFPDGPARMLWTPIDDWTSDASVAEEYLCRHFEVSTLDGFGCREFPVGIQAAGAVLYYGCHAMRRSADHVTQLTPYRPQACMMVDRTTQRNLELVEPLFADSRDATLLSVIDQTVTPMGGRLMREWILRPLLDLDEITARQDAVALFCEDRMLLSEMREIFAMVKDLERTLTRLSVGSANGRDLLALRRGLEALPLIRSVLETVAGGSDRLDELREQLVELPAVTELVEQAIADEPPTTIKEGGVIREGYNETLDEFRSAATEGKKWLAELQQREQERTGIKNIKIRYNKVFGYYIEVSKSNLSLVPEDYLRKQTLVNAERFITPELKEIEDKVLGAEDKSKALEYEIFQTVRAAVAEETATVQASARAVAQLDVLAGLAETALRRNYVRPHVHGGLELDVVDGRHPVVDAMLKDETFVPNGIRLNEDERRMVILTGPNMAGKSTYIRQVALLTLMAQMGSYVPAAVARIGLADRVFTRVGASDDLARGQSTFMVEMLETANILNNASARSLVILDEIGRGTSTYDGLSIAWAVAEHLHASICARTLFATHYHELTQLSTTTRGICNCNVAVEEIDGKVVFLRSIREGAADRSYGIHVAELAKC
jgi:DNA mismatch repair protein MutS